MNNSTDRLNCECEWDCETRKCGTIHFYSVCARACLKNHSRNLHAPLCGRFCPNSVAVARYGALIRTKSPTNCDAHLAESLFQTRSSRRFLYLLAIVAISIRLSFLASVFSRLVTRASAVSRLVRTFTPVSMALRLITNPSF